MKNINNAKQAEAARAKAEYKAKKWAKKIDKYIGETKISELDNEQRRLGEKILKEYRLLNRGDILWLLVILSSQNIMADSEML